MFKYLISAILTLLFLSACIGPASMTQQTKPLKNIKITIDPGHGSTKDYDDFRIGPGGEREEWINLRVAKYLEKKLIQAGAKVLMTREQDKDISLGGRAALAKIHQSDLLISIHHNGSGNDPDMDLPIVYFFGPASKNPASVDFAKILIGEMREKLSFEQPEAGAVYSDYLIYSSGTSILRNTIDQMPGVIGEAGFFTNATSEQRLSSRAYNKLEAEVYFHAILKYFDQGVPFVTPITSDSIKYLDITEKLDFHLNDGFGGSLFEESSFKVLQGDQALPLTWNSMNGTLSVQPLIVEDKHVSFQVFGRNNKGSAIHPRPFTFLTESGHTWYSEQQWRLAFDKADSLFALLESRPLNRSIQLLEESLHLYQLSLELQIVHPKAREAEEQILKLLEMRLKMFPLDDTVELEQQRLRLKEYYPD